MRILVFAVFFLCSAGLLFGANEAACWAPLWLPAATTAVFSVFPLFSIIQNSQNTDLVVIFAASGAAIGALSGLIWGLTDCYLEDDIPQYLAPPPTETPAETAFDFPSLHIDQFDAETRYIPEALLLKGFFPATPQE